MFVRSSIVERVMRAPFIRKVENVFVYNWIFECTHILRFCKGVLFFLSKVNSQYITSTGGENGGLSTTVVVGPTVYLLVTNYLSYRTGRIEYLRKKINLIGHRHIYHHTLTRHNQTVHFIN